MRRACGCLVLRFWRVVVVIDCGLFWLCLRATGAMYEHEDYWRAKGNADHYAGGTTPPRLPERRGRDRRAG